MTYTYRIEDPDDFAPPMMLGKLATSLFVVMAGGVDVKWFFSQEAARDWCRYWHSQEKAA